MKSSSHKRLLFEENLNQFSNLKLENKILFSQPSKKVIYNYIGFFIIYFTLSIINTYLVVYVPVYLFSILNVNRSKLAFIQIFVFSVLFLAPILGFLFDKYDYHKKNILLLSFLLFLISFIFTILSGRILYFFGVFLALNLLCNEIIKVGMSRILLELSSDEKIKDRNLTIINISVNFGGFIPSLIFMFILTDISILKLWTFFFLIGGVLMIPIFSTIFCFDFKNKLPKKKKSLGFTEYPSKIYSIQIFLLTISFIFIWSDRLYQYPFVSWILSKYGQAGLMIYSFSYVFFLILNAFGWLMGQKVSNDSKRKNQKKKRNFNSKPHKKLDFKVIINKRIKIIIITNCIYTLLTFLMVFANFIILLIIYGLIWFVAGIMMLNYISLSISISKKVKYQTVSYQMLRLGLAIASVIFIPLGTYLSSYFSTEFLVLIVGFLSIFSIIPLFFIKYLKMK